MTRHLDLVSLTAQVRSVEMREYSTNANTTAAPSAAQIKLKLDDHPRVYFPQILLRLSLHRWRIRIFDFDPKR
jgi:hypothetical protein